MGRDELDARPVREVRGLGAFKKSLTTEAAWPFVVIVVRRARRRDDPLAERVGPRHRT